MKKVKTLFSALLLTCLAFSAVNAYVVDGMVDDWGIDLDAWSVIGYLDTHLPSGGLDVDVVTEDNADSRTGWQFVGPGYTYDGNYFDAEAIYFDNDAEYGYLAVVQGLGPEGATAPGNPLLLPGDIALSVGDAGYNYGIDIDDSHMYMVDSWLGVYYPQFNAAAPWRIGTGQDMGAIDFVYGAYQNTHYVLEAKFSLDMLGLSAGDVLGIHWTQECGNDVLNLDADVNAVPEPASLFLLLTGLLGAVGIRKKS